jgi:DNA-directed RNA polymerase specialized sigma24 family protein
MNTRAKLDDGLREANQDKENAEQKARKAKALSDKEILWNAAVSVVIAALARAFHIRDRDRLHDIHQATLAVALRKGQVENPGRYSWLWQVARRKSIDLHRCNLTEAKNGVVYNGSLLNGSSAPSLTPEEQAMINRVEECFRKAKEEATRRKPEDAEFCSAHYEEGLSTGEISQRSGLSAQRVAMRLLRFLRLVQTLAIQEFEQEST